uniref:Uncharacterized protein n=1 Tax=Odontella aurita TaxID=265563 RepID=A0A7S4M423_9STRA|mmetsp:Transcript_10438/g.30668  ORF Transcript_10438/g.30668 Transcript_10438/m.30668 type:complete len:623 (+) Transcript_10438:3-1871(+)
MDLTSTSDPFPSFAMDSATPFRPPAERSLYLQAAFLLNDVGTLHHSRGQLAEAARFYMESLKMRSEAIDVAVAAACGSKAEVESMRSREDMEAYCSDLGMYFHYEREKSDASVEKTQQQHRLEEEDECEPNIFDAEQEEDRSDEEEEEEGEGSASQFFHIPMEILSTSRWTPVENSLLPHATACMDDKYCAGDDYDDASSVTLHNMSSVQVQRGNCAQALELLHMAVDSATKQSDGSSDLFRAVLRGNRAVLLRCGLGRPDEEVVPDMDEAARLALPLVIGRQQDRDAAAQHVLLNAAAIYIAMGCYDNAIHLCGAVSSTVTSCLVSPNTTNYPSNSDPEMTAMLATKPPSAMDAALHRRAYLLVASALHSLGSDLHSRGTGNGGNGDLRSALPPLARALFVRSCLIGESHPTSIRTVYALGRLLHDQEEYVDALGMYRRAAEAWEARLRCWRSGLARHPCKGGCSSSAASSKLDAHLRVLQDLLNVLCNIAKVHIVQGSQLDALDACDRALGHISSLWQQCTEELAPDSHFRLLLSEFALVLLHLKGSVHEEMGRSEEAVRCFVAAARTMEMPLWRDLKTLAGNGSGDATRCIPPLINLFGRKVGRNVANNNDASPAAAVA